MSSDRLFVYGTLMRGFDHPMAKLLSRSADFLGAARCRGRLYLIKHYPGLVLSDDPTESCSANCTACASATPCSASSTCMRPAARVFRSRPNISARCCRWTLDDGSAGEAWTYIYNWPVTGLPRIALGEFLEG